MVIGVSGNTFGFRTQFNRNVSEQNSVLRRLATGRRINSGKDDPAGLIAATQLEAQLAVLDAESRSIQRAHVNANVADGHLTQLSSMTNELRGLLAASANTGALSDAEIAANQMQIDNLSQSIQRFSQDAIASLDGFNLPEGGNEALAQQLSEAANAAATLSSNGANRLDSGNFAAAEAALEQATTAFAEARGTIGAYQKYTLETRQNSLAVERENLTAAHSQIVDADMAAEAANLARSNVLAETSLRALKIANDNAGMVLSLLT